MKDYTEIERKDFPSNRKLHLQIKNQKKDGFLRIFVKRIKTGASIVKKYYFLVRKKGNEDPDIL